MPKVRLISFNNFRIDCVVAGSNALVASSHNNTLGSLAKARAMATRVFAHQKDCLGKHHVFHLNQQALKVR